jgi:2-dehydropantoate 2-reductase
MYRDMQGNALVEVDQILGDMLFRARGLNLATPLLEAAVAQLQVYQNRILATVSDTPALPASRQE